MDAFFAAVELLRRPDLRGKPVIIGGRGDPSRRGVVATATYEARKFGVHSGMPFRTAQRLCPDAVYLPTDFAEYARWSQVFKAAMQDVSPLFEDRGIDEAYLDISANGEPSDALGRQLKARILADTAMTCSIGIAPNKLLAKIASDLDKPDGLTILSPEDIEPRIWPLPARKIPGIGAKAEQKLDALGIQSIGELAAAPLVRLARHFGNAMAAFMHAAAHGQHDTPVVTVREPKSRSRETTFQEDVADPRVIEQTLAALSAQVAEDLRRRGYAGRTVGIKLRFADFRTLTRDRTLAEPTDDARVITEAARECLRRVKLDRRVRLLGVRVTELAPVTGAAARSDLYDGVAAQ
ncbi:MAG: DNA polymerase IV [Betaproteobacteria bacterium]|nr:DNA polymerase IV [Betaproteobacteria bacterium]